MFFLATEKTSFRFKAVLVCILVSFTLMSVVPTQALAQGVFSLPTPGSMVNLSPGFVPVMLRGIKVYPDNPFKFDFIVDSGNTGLQADELKGESEKLAKYFLAALTTPEQDLWVNLSPYEDDRIIPEPLGQTDMGRDLLAQDYILKQITASLIYPDSESGKDFWAKVYKKAYEEYGTTKIPVNTFNKVWIVPEKAVVYQDAEKAFVTESHLKVMLEQDYLSLENNSQSAKLGTQAEAQADVEKTSELSSNIVREVVLPLLEKEVNEGENFANLRQIYHAMVLATWYKQALKTSILNKVYTDKSKVSGVNVSDPQATEKIYDRYLDAFEKGVCNMVRVEQDPATQQPIARKYFSGGFEGNKISSSISSRPLASLKTVVTTFVVGAMFLTSVALTNPVQGQDVGRSPVKTETKIAGSDSVSKLIDKLNRQAEKGSQEAIAELGSLAEDRNGQAVDALKGLAQSYNLDALKILRSVASTRHNTMAREALKALDLTEYITRANQGDIEAIGALANIAGWSNPSARKTIEEIDITALVGRAESGEMQVLGVLEEMDRDNSSVPGALRNLNVGKYGDLAAQGNSEAVTYLRDLAYTYKNQSAKETLLTFDVAEFKNLAEKGDKNALGELGKLDDDLNPFAREALQNLDVVVYKERAEQGDLEMAQELSDLALVYENSLAQKAVQDLDVGKYGELAAQGVSNVVFTLSNLAYVGSVSAQNALSSLDVSGYKEKAGQGDLESVNDLKTLANTYSNASAQQALSAVSIASEFKAKVEQGSLESFRILEELAGNDWKNSSAQATLRNLDMNNFVALAQEGDQEVIASLQLLALVYKNSSAKNILETLDISNIRDLAIQGDESMTLNLKILSKYGNTLALSALADVAQQGSPEAVTYLEDLAAYDNLGAQEFLEKLDMSNIANLAKQNNERAVLSLKYLASYGNQSALSELSNLVQQGNKKATQHLTLLAFQGNALAQEAVIGMDVTRIADLSRQGNLESVDVLVSLVQSGNTKALDTLKTLDAAKIKDLAENGDQDAINSLYSLSYYKNPSAQEAVDNFDVTKITESARRGDVVAVNTLKNLASKGNLVAIPAIKELAQNGNREAINALSDLVIKNKDRDSYRFLIENFLGSQEMLPRVTLSLQYQSLREVESINRLHELSDAERFASIKDATPKELYTLMTYGREEIYTSSFNGIFDRLLTQQKAQKLSGKDLLESIGYNEFRTFIEGMASYGRLTDFLNTSDANYNEILLKKFIQSVDQERDALAQAATVAEVFGVMEDPATLAVLQETVKQEYERVSENEDYEGMNIYGLLSGMFGRRSVVDDKWSSDVARQYNLPDLTVLPEQSAFDSLGRHVQRQSFYNDGDGISSYNSFLATYRADPRWKVEDRDTYIVVSGRSGTRSVEIYSNKPQFESEGQEAMSKFFQENNIVPRSEVHRGHSYHAYATINRISDKTAFVYMGGCGGYQNMSSILDLSSQAQIISTKGTGTMLVNDPLLKEFNDALLANGNIYWPDFWKNQEAKFKGVEGFERYVAPHRNLGAIYIKAYYNLLMNNQVIRISQEKNRPIAFRIAPIKAYQLPYKKGTSQGIKLFQKETGQNVNPSPEGINLDIPHSSDVTYAWLKGYLSDQLNGHPNKEELISDAVRRLDDAPYQLRAKEKIDETAANIARTVLQESGRRREAIAQEASMPAVDPVGGIDLNAKNLDLKTKGQDIEFAVPAEWQNVDLNNIQGFAPVILNIVPIANLQGLMSVNLTESPISNPS